MTPPIDAPEPADAGVARLPATRIVGILGGMGPAAGADFTRLFVEACTDLLRARGLAVTDQAFPEHWLAQVPVPDRTRALGCEGPERDAPFEPMARAIGQLASLGACAVAIACNTAHSWHGALQARFPGIELLHAPREVAAHLASRSHRKAALLATQGTYRTGLYESALAEAGIACHLPSEAQRETLMRGIYDGVKAGDLEFARTCFVGVARELLERHGDVPLVMGCTEIPLPLADAPQARGWTLVNSTEVLARALAARAYAPQGRADTGGGASRPA